MNIMTAIFVISTPAIRTEENFFKSFKLVKDLEGNDTWTLNSPFRYFAVSPKKLRGIKPIGE